MTQYQVVAAASDAEMFELSPDQIDRISGGDDDPYKPFDHVVCYTQGLPGQTPYTICAIP